MVTTTHQVFNEIKEYIRKKGERYQDWYVGTTSDIRYGLFLEHHVSEKQSLWIFRTCPDIRTAKRIKEVLMTLGCKGRGDEWDAAATSVYAYRTSPDTTP